MSFTKLRWNLTPKEIIAGAKEIVTKTRQVYDRIGAIPENEITFQNVIKPIADDMSYSHTLRSLYEFPQHVSSNKELREASTEADKALSEFDVECSMREDVHKAVLNFQKNNKTQLKPEAQRFVDRILRDFKRNGLFLPEDQRNQAKDIKKEISDLCIEFSKNLGNENTTLEFTDEELVGLPSSFIESLEKSESTGKRIVTLKYPHYFPISKKAKNPETRKKMEFAFNSRCLNENVPILEKVIKLRHKLAKLMDYENHATFSTETLMAKNPQNVHKFLDDLTEKLANPSKKELEVLLELKKQECAENNWSFDGIINAWDFRYYANLVEERDYSVNHEEIQQYFPMEVVSKGMFEIYEKLLSVKFVKVTLDSSFYWHEDVELYRVDDTLNNNQTLGYFYLDLFPREGKYGHAACFGLQPSCILEDGTRQVSICAMVANFTKPTKDKPSLLQHDEVETYFHEFGHAMHNICAQADYALFAGTHVERDFVEAPSQMLENWCYEKAPLRMLSCHNETKAVLPDDLIEKLAKMRNANTALLTKRQILFAKFDQQIHTMEEADTAKIYSEFANKYFGIPATPGTNFAASFGHLVGGYDARYFGYLWSEVFSMDMFFSLFKGKELDSEVGLKYRQNILAPGGTIDGGDMLRNFLGRDPTPEAFLKSKGLEV